MSEVISDMGKKDSRKRIGGTIWWWVGEGLQF